MKLHQLEQLEFVELNDQEAQQINGGIRYYALPLGKSEVFYNTATGQLLLPQDNVVSVPYNPGLPTASMP